MSQVRCALRALVLAAALGTGVGGPAWAQQPAPSAPAPATVGDPFAQSQQADPSLAAAPAFRGAQVSLHGFVDAGYVHISQSGPVEQSSGDTSWAYGNSQFMFFAGNDTFTLNEVDLTLDAQRERDGLIHGMRASIDFYPSRDNEVYAGTPDLTNVDQAYVFAEWSRAWHTRLVLGRAPGFMTLEQQEGDSPDLRLIGHTYVYQAGGGYPYGVQLHVRPGAWSFKLGYSNGGLAGYPFVPGDRSTVNRWVARDNDTATASDAADGRTAYGAVQWTPFDQPAEIGTLRLGVATGANPALTYNATTQQTEPYSLNTTYAGYRLGALELRGEYAALESYVESFGRLDLNATSLLVSWYAGASHLLTLRLEQMDFTTGRSPTPDGSATKQGLSYRYTVSEAMVVKVEAVHEFQAPQFIVATGGLDLTTDVLATSWVYSF